MSILLLQGSHLEKKVCGYSVRIALSSSFRFETFLVLCPKWYSMFPDDKTKSQISFHNVYRYRSLIISSGWQGMNNAPQAPILLNSIDFIYRGLTYLIHNHRHAPCSADLAGGEDASEILSSVSLRSQMKT